MWFSLEVARVSCVLLCMALACFCVSRGKFSLWFNFLNSVPECLLFFDSSSLFLSFSHNHLSLTSVLSSPTYRKIRKWTILFESFKGLLAIESNHELCFKPTKLLRKKTSRSMQFFKDNHIYCENKNWVNWRHNGFLLFPGKIAQKSCLAN